MLMKYIDISSTFSYNYRLANGIADENDSWHTCCYQLLTLQYYMFLNKNKVNT